MHKVSKCSHVGEVTYMHCYITRLKHQLVQILLSEMLALVDVLFEMLE
jgi:hypothetical protein